MSSDSEIKRSSLKRSIKLNKKMVGKQLLTMILKTSALIIQEAKILKIKIIWVIPPSLLPSLVKTLRKLFQMISVQKTLSKAFLTTCEAQF